MSELSTENPESYLKPTYFMDFDHPEVIRFAEDTCTGIKGKTEKAIRLYYAVRDGIRYNPYDVGNSGIAFKASSVLKKKSGYCVVKAVLLAAVARYHGIPARLGFADVRNHLTTKRLQEAMEGSDLFVYHGYTEMLLNDKWVKATPAFNLSLCTHFNVKPLEFNGLEDSIFHEFDTKGNKHMEYVADHGHFEDLPLERIFDAFEKAYPALFKENMAIQGDFFREAVEDSPDA